MDADMYTYLTNVAYLAGIIDGEGCITIGKTTKGRYSGGTRIDWRLILDITNNDRTLMQWLEDTFGHIVETSYRRRSNRSNSYGWTASGRQCQELLEIVLPFLKVKKAQAELALQMNIAKYGGSSRWTYTQEEEENRERIYRAIRELNSKNGGKGGYQRTNNTRKEVSAPSQ